MKEKEEKYYVVRPMKESHFDDEFRLVGTKEDIAKYITEYSIEQSIEAREIDKISLDAKKPMFFIEFHSGSSDGTSGFGSSKVCKTIKEAKEWMMKYLKEATFYEAPHSFIFNIEPIYWIDFSNDDEQKEKR